MPERTSFVKNKWTWIIGIPVLLVVLVVGGYLVLHQRDRRPACEADAVGCVDDEAEQRVLVDQAE